jgi:hypothetical protein
MWLLRTGVAGALNTTGTVLVISLLTLSVALVVSIGVLGFRKIDDVRIRTKLRWERSHRHVPGLRSGDD